VIVRCGACRTEFEVPGEGTFVCPTCGTQNAIRRQGDPGAPEGPGGPVVPGPRPAPAPETPSPRVECPDCGFRFIVGDVDTAVCPNCGVAVQVGEKEA
jgi:DNA-directed RNA polymerase subunit RPC12/RpoP